MSRGSFGSLPDFVCNTHLNKQDWESGQTEVVFSSHSTPAVSDHPFVGQLNVSRELHLR